MDARWRIWMRSGPEEDWMEPVMAGGDAEVGWESEEDAEMIAESFRDLASPGVQVLVLREGQNPSDAA
jgi:accessory colonization factor AcfC